MTGNRAGFGSLPSGRSARLLHLRLAPLFLLEQLAQYFHAFPDR